jgi:phospholysine phosphohistidine inorganic pyrophosphate phosphatase
MLRGVLIDLDGVIYEGDRAVPGAAEAVARLEAAGIPHLFLTNTTSRPREALVARLAGFEVVTKVEEISTPAVAADRWLAANAPGPAALFVPEATASEFCSVPRLPDDVDQGAASVVLGDLGEAWDFPKLNRAFRLLMAEPRPAFVALGMTRYWLASDGLRLDVAPFVKALEHATGAGAVVLGKPARDFYEASLQLLGCKASETLMVGDDVVGDVQGAQRVGIHGMLVRTGKFRPTDLEGEIRPDAILGSIAELPAWWEDHAGEEGAGD